MARPCPICDLEPQVVTFADLTLDRRTRRIFVGSEHRHMAPAQFDILELLMLDPGRVWSHAKLVHQLDPAGLRNIAPGTVHQEVMHIRRVLKGAGVAVSNRKAHGYSIELPENAIPVFRRGNPIKSACHQEARA